MTKNEQATVNQLRQHKAELKQRIVELKTLLFHKNETANVFMNQVKKLQSLDAHKRIAELEQQNSHALKTYLEQSAKMEQRERVLVTVLTNCKTQQHGPRNRIHNQAKCSLCAYIDGALQATPPAQKEGK